MAETMSKPDEARMVCELCGKEVDPETTEEVAPGLIVHWEHVEEGGVVTKTGCGPVEWVN